MSQPRFEQELRAAAQGDYAARRKAEARLAKGARSQRRLLAQLGADPELAVRRTVVEVLRRNAPNAWASKQLLARLREEDDVKTRRRICAALGESRDAELVKPLLARLEQEPHRYAQASLVLALGKLGFEAWPEPWRRRAEGDGPVADALRLAGALGAAPADAATSRRRSAPKRPLGSYAAEIHPGSATLGALEWRARGLGEGAPAAPGWVLLDAEQEDRVAALASLRTILADHHVLERKTGVSAADLLKTAAPRLVACAGPELRFRLALPREASWHAYRSAIKKLSREVARLTGWTNDPSDYDVDLRVVRFSGLDDSLAVLWRHREWPTPRAKPREAVAASIHPSVAAGLCWLASSRLERAAGPPVAPVLLDPCCGAGTIVDEWLAGGAGRLAHGSDTSVDALWTARGNLVSYGARASLWRGELGRVPLRPESVHTVVANLPFGLRTRSAQRPELLAGRFVREAQRLLVPGGAWVAYTSASRAVARAIADAASVADLTPTAQIDAGGLQVRVFASP